MELKIKRNVSLKVISVLLSLLISIIPFFQPKRVQANPLIVGAACIASILLGMKAAGYANNIILTPEQMTATNEELTANLQVAFPDPAEYNKQLNALQNLDNDLKAGREVDWSKYSGKALYAVLKGVVDVVWPVEITNVPQSEIFVGSIGKYYVTKKVNSSYAQYGIPNHGWSKYLYDVNSYTNNPSKKAESSNTAGYFYVRERGYESYSPNYTYYVMTLTNNPSGFYYFMMPSTVQWNKYLASVLGLPGDFSQVDNVLFVPSIKNKTANKVKLPTRLPQTVINNINNYIDNSTENLIIAPTADELPTLPDNYNPNTDDPPDLPGYEDVPPDQPGTTDPEPTPSPTPEPTPTPPEYDGSSWIKPIGDFFAGLLSFLKDALIPTQTVDFSPLQNMGADVSGKFPFSLPGDIGKLFGVLNAEPIRPHFEMDFDLSKVGIPGEPIHWDLNVEQWDNGAAVVKTALYIAFLIGLVFITKQFMQN